MSLRYRFFGVPCGFCGRPVDRIQVYVNAVVTVHKPGLGPDCMVVHTVGPRAGNVVEEVPHSLASSAYSVRRAA